MPSEWGGWPYDGVDLSNSSTWEMEVQILHVYLKSKFKASLGSIRPSQKGKENEDSRIQVIQKRK